MSDQQWDGDKVPDGLAQALGERSLSNPAVVGDLVGGFVQHVGELAGKCWDEEMTGPELDAAIKDLCLPVSGLRPVGEAISTVGGIPVGALNADFSFKAHPHFSAIGEMVDWDAPTGGFLLQGCFAMGRHAALGILSKHGNHAEP